MISARRHPVLLTLLSAFLLFAPSIAEAAIIVDQVHFHGNESVDKKNLLDVMIMRPPILFGLINKVEYDEGVLEEDLDYVQLYYRQHGWLEAEVLRHEVEVDSADKHVVIDIWIEEGPRTYITDIMTFGNDYFADEKILDEFDIEPGDPLNRIWIQDQAQQVTRMYQNYGFLKARTTPAIMVDKEAHEAFIDLSITERTRFHVGDVIVTGLEETQNFIVRRELEFEKGDVLRQRELAETQRNLYETGLFRSVFVRQEETLADSTKMDILVEIVEQKPLVFSSQAGYATLEKLRSRAEIRHENLFGTGRAAGIAGYISYIDRGVEFNYVEPWTFFTRWTTDVLLSAKYRNEPSFDYASWGARVTVRRRVFRRGYFSVGYRHENAEYTNIDIIDFDKTEHPRIRSLSQSFSYDTRNDPFTPTSGWLGSLTNEYALQFLGSTDEFFKTRANFRYFFEWTTGTVLATNIQAGWVDAGGGLANIPLGERLYAGGPNALRGFVYRGVGPSDEDDGTPLGGRVKLVWNALEVRQHIAWRFGAVAFVDVGNVFEKAENVSLMNMRITPGAGIRIASPVGLLRFDVGWNPYSERDEDHLAYHLSVGHAF